ncbi:MAG TPA: NAD(P)H-hydrate dehydratase [Egibacteraceae bacterium]|nr:NAD(P)H-hydrate dehydratase [Egibacteraceae bacterium]
MSIPLYTPAQVREMDRRAFARGVSGGALMERAAGHLARGVVDVGGRGYGLRVGILAGRGNNGGDGLAAARRLLDAGAAPRVCLVGGAGDLSPDAAEHLARYHAAGGRLVASVGAALAGADVGVDCLLGTGASGQPREPYRSAVGELNRSASFSGGMAVVACDVPTGVDADTGAVPGEAVRADLTVSLGAHKRGLHLWPARGHCGRLVLGDLGIADGADAPVATVLERADVAALLPRLEPTAHKRTRGVVVALAGSAGMSGAAALVARGAMAAGAGLVTLATSGAVLPLVAPAVPEALTAALPDDDPDAAFARLAAALEGADALAVGPGLGRSEAAVALVRRVVAEVDVPLVLDADGINAFSAEADPARPDTLADHASTLLVLTPHAGELARLLPGGRDEAWARRATLVPERAKGWGAVVVAKGAGSLTAAPDGRVWVNPTGGPALATGGTGDVLTGMVATLLAQRPEAESVAVAVYVHGLAGELAASRGERSVTALDVAGAVPAAMRSETGQ